MSAGPSQGVMRALGKGLIGRPMHPQHDVQFCCLNHISVAVHRNSRSQCYRHHTTLCRHFIQQEPILKLPMLQAV